MEVTPDFSQAPPSPPKNNKEMLSVLTDGEQMTVRINPSSLGVILSCPRKSHYELDRKLKLQTAPQTFGTAVHKALDVFYRSSVRDRNIPEDFQLHTDNMVLGHAPPSDHFLYQAIAGFIETAQPLRDLPATDKRSIESGVWILREYFQQYIDDPYTVASDANGPIVERTCETVLHETKNFKIVLFGTIDVVLKNETNGTVLPTDHKTASYLGTDFYNRCKPNHQYTAYLLLAREVLGIDSDQFLVNALQVKPKPVTARGTRPNFARQITSRSAEDFDDFRMTVKWAVAQYLNWFGTGNWPVGSVESCANYGGCSFLEICSAPSSLRENLIQSKFGS